MTEALAGLTVVDATEGIAGPYAGQTLGDYGATVTKVERPGGDRSRGWGPPMLGGTGAAFQMLNRNKTSIVIDYETEAGIEELLRLLAGADVFIHDEALLQPSSGDLGEARLRSLNARLVICSITGLGSDGEWSGRAVSELEVQGYSGVTRYLARPGEAPVRIGADVCSVATGQAAYQGILAALYARDTATGIGDTVHVSLLQSVLALESIMLAALDLPDDWAGHHCLAESNDPDFGYRTKDRPIYFGQAYRSDEPWLELCDYLGTQELVGDPRFHSRAARTVNAAALKPLLEEAFEHFPSKELVERVTAMGNTAIPVNDHKTLAEHPQTSEMHMFVSIDALSVLGPPWEMSDTPGVVKSPAPPLPMGIAGEKEGS